MSAKQLRRWWFGPMVIVAAGLGCADDEVPESDSKAIAEGDDEGAEAGGGTDPQCGDGEIDQGEDCDDGNATDDDQCTNACMLPSCGDGIVHTDDGETCDDGNLELGDGCSPLCRLRGTELANHTSDWFTLGSAVVIDSNDQITVLGRANGDSWIAKFDDEFDTAWDASALPGNPPGLAIGSDDELLIAGQVGDQARTKRINPHDGADLWLDGVPFQESAFSSVAAAGDHMVAAGHFGEMFHEQGVLV
ncbi:MAG TPA: DUF4215 domain-containing protein, partial [Enhygromyxa sp.]|nr:DUF4215 domain-containing protein [Enhygromyxa sp.]